MEQTFPETVGDEGRTSGGSAGTSGRAVRGNRERRQLHRQDQGDFGADCRGELPGDSCRHGVFKRREFP